MLMLFQLLVAALLVIPFIRKWRHTVRHCYGRTAKSSHTISPSPNLLHGGWKTEPVVIADSTTPRETRATNVMLYKDLYFKLHNLEENPDVLPRARNVLLFLLSRTISDASKAAQTTILSVEHYSRDSLVAFLGTEHKKTMKDWEAYLARRRSGSPMEMFANRDQAQSWLKAIATVKYVDGAWLGHLHKISTPFALRPITRVAWQILSEELGDGDLAKNHVHVFQELVKAVEPEFPIGFELDFTDSRHRLDDPRIWEAGVAQLLISLFPHDFLPEILGFNMHFEKVTAETMMAAKELKEMNLDPYYFTLHVSIDNAHSGHTAIAAHAAMKYLDHVEASQGVQDVQKTWRRIQAGYVLSAGLPTAPSYKSMESASSGLSPESGCEREMIKMFQAKAVVAHRIHASSQLSIGGKPLVEWLDPNALDSTQWQKEFLSHLSTAKPWVYKGESAKSKLVQEMLWGGKMFGAFTKNEVGIVTKWIDSLETPNSQAYWTFTGRSEATLEENFESQDICLNYPVFAPTPPFPFSALSSKVRNLDFDIDIRLFPAVSKLFPLWFSHLCLLESFICIPARTTTKTVCAILRLLRAQYGFATEGSVVAGTDETHRSQVIGLLELGLEMIRTAGLPEPRCLKEVLQVWPSEFAVMMLHLSMRPISNKGLLLGLTSAFKCLHDVMTSPSFTLLSAASREIMGEIAHREEINLIICMEEIENSPMDLETFWTGFHAGKAEVEACFACDTELHEQRLQRSPPAPGLLNMVV